LKIVNHMAFAAGVGALVGYSLPGCTALALGASIPDMIDGVLSGNIKEVWQGIHRTISHWPPFFVGLFALYMIYGADFLRSASAGLPFEVPDQLMFLFFVGALLHISCDFLTPMGIPLVPPFRKKDRISARLIVTGSVFDYLLGFTPLAIFCMIVLFGNI